jgi:hypothetical protein
MDECDACGREVPVAGGIANFWTLEKTETGGLLLELADGSDHFLCFECIEDLPDDREPTAEDVAELKSTRERGEDGGEA